MIRTPLLKAIQRALREAENQTTRRTFLKEAGMIGATALALPTLARLGSSTAFAADLPSSRVHILGGGIAGLAAAYHLQKAGIESVIYEASTRLGGRIFTLENFNDEGMFCEMGGELLDSDHTEVFALATELGLTVEDFKSEDAGIEPFHFYFGGKHYFEKDLVEPFKPLARRLTDDLNGLFVDPASPVILYSTATEKAKKLDQIPLTTYLDQVPGLEPWVRDLMHVAYVGEYGLEAEEQSALNLLILMPEMSTGFKPFGSSDECRRIKGGNSRLIEALAEKVKPSTEIRMGCRLDKIQRDGSQILLTFDAGGKTETVAADQVVCTLPLTVLRGIEGIGAIGLNERNLACVLESGYGTNSKRMLGFKHRFWRTGDKKCSGLIFTNLPSQCFWETSRMQPGTQGILTNFLGGRPGAKISAQSDVMTELDQIYPEASAEFTGKGVQFNWGSYAWAKGSYSCPKIGQVTRFSGCLAEPELGGRLLFAGEHVSVDFQGFINGAAESARSAAEWITAQRKKKAPAQERKHASRAVPAYDSIGTEWGA